MALPIKFSSPPVAEVVCGVLFATPAELKSFHVGLFWQSIREEFPKLEEVGPINPVIEAAQLSITPEVQMELMNLPPMRRTWLWDRTGNSLIQIQQDRFLFNWKHVDNQGSYPSYEVVIKQFEKHLSAFSNFLRAQGMGELIYRQFELTYVNVISSANGLKDVSRTGALVDHVRSPSAARFLPEPEAFAWNTSYSLPNGMGRLHVNAQTAFQRETKEPVLRLELTARGITPDPSEKFRRPWFDLGHEWITRGFADSTPDKLHKTWGRIS